MIDDPGLRAGMRRRQTDRPPTHTVQISTDPTADAPGDGSERPVRRSARHAATAARRRRRRRRVLLVIAVVLIPIMYSYLSALTGPGSDSLSARSVEWMRDHRLGGVVDAVERRWYDHHQAKVGGTPNVSTATPQLAIAAATSSTTASTTERPPTSNTPRPATTTSPAATSTTAATPSVAAAASATSSAARAGGVDHPHRCRPRR